MREQSCEILSPTRAVAIATPVTNWLKIFGQAAADGAAVADPYDATGFTTLAKEVHITSGRTLLNRRGQGQLEILPLATVAEAAVTFQLWGFDWLPATEKRFTDSDLFFPQQPAADDGNKGLALGLPYNLALDNGLPTTAVIGPVPSHETQSMTISFSGAQPYNNQGGTTYFYGSRIRLPNCAGLWAVWPWVVTISTGEAVLLARWV